MRKKNPTSDNIYAMFGYPAKQPGRGPKGPDDVQDRLEELIKHSETWMRRCDEVWFFTGSPLIEDAVGATQLPDLPELYDEAIAVMQWVAGYAKRAEEKLKKGQRAAKRKKKEAGTGRKAAAEKPRSENRATKVAAKNRQKKSTQEELEEYFSGAFD